MPENMEGSNRCSEGYLKSPQVLGVLISIIFCGAVISLHWSRPLQILELQNTQSHNQQNTTKGQILNCKSGIKPNICSAVEYPFYNKKTINQTRQDVCPAYFRWMYEDLRPWQSTRISLDMVENAKQRAHFRLIIRNGRAYVERYRRSFQTRDVFTIWGILQLLRRYPGRVRDLDLMFNCNDHPGIMKGKTYANLTAPPPLFGYCQRQGTVGFIFPDWSYWGWPEVNIKPWEPLSKDLEQGNKMLKWVNREPYAFWKGNPNVSGKRKRLFRCNPTKTKDYNARLYHLNWPAEGRRGFKNTNLANQCDHRYKIYVEGSAWSVSQKYILACDSMTLFVQPEYYDFFARGLMPMSHYWPIKGGNNECESIKYAVNWGNSHQEQAQMIGKAASSFTQEELKMDYVYDYMLHLLNEYAKLLTYKPSIPPRAKEMCMETMACPARGLIRKFMLDSMERGPSISMPCSMQ